LPVEALPGFLRALSYVEPLRQVIEGTRSILYFNAQGVAGLTRGTVAAAAGLLFWLVVGGCVVQWYDRRGFYRLRPEILAHVNQSVQDFHAKEVEQAEEAEQAEQAEQADRPSQADEAGPAPEPSESAQPPGGDTGKGGAPSDGVS
jgi:hypothetical protein